MEKITFLFAIPTKKPRNRAEKRELVRELTLLNTLLLERAEGRFLRVLHSVNTGVQPDGRVIDIQDYSRKYSMLYKHALVSFNEVVDYIRTVVKPKHCFIDPHYFEKCYKPI